MPGDNAASEITSGFKSMSEPTLPNFLVIGAAKAGTTALWHFLSSHPQIFMSRHKEPRYFAVCNNTSEWQGPGDQSTFVFTRTWEDYLKLFRRVIDERAIGEASPWYLYVPSAAEEIKKRLPAVKLVAILRKPAERAFSNYLHARNEGLDPEPTFRGALEREAERIASGWSPRFHYIQKGFYFKQLTHYFSLFSEHQMRIYLYDDLLRNPSGLMEDLFSFLEVDVNHYVDTSKRYNDSRVHRSPVLHALVKRVRPLLRAMLPSGAQETLRGTYEDMNRVPKPELSDEDREYLLSLYHDDVRRLQDLLGRDLSTWL